MTTYKQQVETVARAMADEDDDLGWRPESDRAEWYRNLARAALAALGITDTAPAPDMVRVPREPTDAMLDAGWTHVTRRLEDGQPDALEALYRAMLDTAPAPAISGGEMVRLAGKLAEWKDAHHDCDCPPHDSCGCKELREIIQGMECCGITAPAPDMVLVPREPTQAMIEAVAYSSMEFSAGGEDSFYYISEDNAREYWADFLAAAPAPQQGETE